MPPGPAGRHACGAASVGPAAARARPRARERYLHPRLPDSAPAEARLPQRDATCAGHRHARAASSILPDGLRVATPAQAAAAACGRARRLARPRLLDISDTTGRRDVDTTVTRIWQPARPRALPLGPGGAKPVPVKPVPVSRARSSSRLRPVGALVYLLTFKSAVSSIKSGPLDSSLVIGAMRIKALPRRRRHADAADAESRHGSTTSPPLAAHTHPCSTHLHLHRTHHTLTSPPATRSPLPLQRPCPSSHVSRACAQPSQDTTFSSPIAVGETPGSSYQLHEDNNAGQGATHDESLAVRASTVHECKGPPAACSPPAAKGVRLGNRAMIAPVSSLCLACPRHAPVLSE